MPSLFNMACLKAISDRQAGVESAHCVRQRVFRADRRLPGRESAADRPIPGSDRADMVASKRTFTSAGCEPAQRIFDGRVLVRPL
jgi:hypothetical protein